MARFRNRPIRCLLDSGCERSVIGRRYAKGMQLKRSKYELFAANKTSLPVDGDVDIHVTIDGHPMTANHGRRIHRSWGGHIPPLFLHRGVSGYINSLQLFNNTTCLQSCNVVFPALRHSTAIIRLHSQSHTLTSKLDRSTETAVTLNCHASRILSGFSFL